MIFIKDREDVDECIKKDLIKNKVKRLLFVIKNKHAIIISPEVEVYSEDTSK